jgi:hypothetical protein
MEMNPETLGTRAPVEELVPSMSNNEEEEYFKKKKQRST